MKIIPLSEGSFNVGADKIFTKAGEQNDSNGKILVEVQPFCIITRRDIILLDTGLGFKQEGKPQIIANLNAEGINADEVTKVLMSHLHKDHAGGISHEDRMGNRKLNFPNATYFVQQREYDAAMDSSSPSFLLEAFEVFDHNPRVFWLLDDKGTIDNYIRYEVTGAHSPFHTVFHIEEEGEIIFYGGDDAPQEKQMHSRFIAKYDHDGRKAMELRQQWWNQGKKENWNFLFYHDIHTPVKKPKTKTPKS